MKTLFLFLLTCLCAYGQAPTYYHDPSLDGIQGGVANVDADLNGYLSQQLTMYQLNTNAAYTFSAMSSNSGTYCTVFTNATSASNAPAISSAISNLVGAFSLGISTNLSIGTNDGVATVSNNTYSIPLGTLSGTSFNMDLGYSFFSSYVPSFQAVGSVLRPLLLAIFSLIVLVWEMDYVTEYGKQLFSAKQTGGSTQETLGTNASLPIGLIYSAVITGLVVGAIGFCASYFFTGTGAAQMASVLSIKSNVSTVTQSFPLWPIITSFIPVSGMFTIFINYLVFRYILTYPVFMVIHTIVLFFII